MNRAVAALLISVSGGLLCPAMSVDIAFAQSRDRTHMTRNGISEARDAQEVRAIPETRDAQEVRAIPETRDAQGGRAIPETRDAQKVRTIPETRDARPYTRWWWFADVIRKEDVRVQLNWLRDNGF
ncbi:MAG: hypothetical protein WC824_14205, partial [Bacteroidota bacterium]